MNTIDFDFITRRHESSVAGTAGKTSRNGDGKSGATLSASSTPPVAVNEGEKFLRIVAQTSRIKRHYELFQLLQGEEIQHFIPHQVLISAWGDFGGPNLQLDVISAIQGVRTGQLNGCGSGVEQLLKGIFVRWVAGGRQPMLLDNLEAEPITNSTCDCALHLAMRRMRSVQVHGFRNERDDLDSLYVTLNPVSAKNEPSAESFSFLVDSLVAQLDVAFRKVAALKPVGSTADEHISPRFDNLSAREQEILRWITAGKTNVEIAGILGISAFTVKNHLQRIFRKLGATNRTEAAAKYRQDNLKSQSDTSWRETAMSA